MFILLTCCLGLPNVGAGRWLEQGSFLVADLMTVDTLLAEALKASGVGRDELLRVLLKRIDWPMV